jgi:type II secretory pathway component GspD/PulD (secretin)
VIVPDETVQGTISVNLKNVPFEQALTIVLTPGNYSWVKLAGFYLVGKAEPTSPNFLRFASTQTYKPNYTTAERLVTLLPPSMASYVKSSQGELTLTITAAPAMMDRILQDIRILDRAPPRIVLEALVTEVSSEILNQYNFSWVWRQFGLSADPDGSEFRYTRASASDVASLKMLVGQGKAEVRANPRIMTVEGKEALVEVAQESYFQVITGPPTFPYATLQQIKTGISLKMTPILSASGEVTVQLAPEVSDAVGSGPGGLPINTVRRASTTVRVKEGETIVIGGMSYTSNRRRDNKVPILGDIPLLGQLFRSHRNEQRKTEVIIMITPRIVREGD